MKANILLLCLDIKTDGVEYLIIIKLFTLVGVWSSY